MEEGKEQLDHLFAKAKNEKVTYNIAKVAATVGGTSMVTAAIAAASKSAINLSSLSIMIGSVLTVATTVVVITTTGNENNTEIATSVNTVKESKIVTAATPKQPSNQVKQLDFIPKDIFKEQEILEIVEIEEDVEELVTYDLAEEEIRTEDRHIDCFESENNEPLSNGVELQPFHSVSLNIPVNVNLQKGDGFKAEVMAEEDLKELIAFTIVNEVLYLDIKEGKRKEFKRRVGNGDLDIILTLNKLNSLSINGSGNIYAMKTIDSDELAITINGSGEVVLEDVVPTHFSVIINGSGEVLMYGKGTVKSGEINVNGSGDACTRSLKVDAMKVIIMGSGDATINCDKELDITIMGSGDVCYKGNATVNISKLGSGDVVNCDK